VGKKFVKSLRPITAAAAIAAIALIPASALAQRQAPATPEQRIERLEKQLQQVQRQVFPRGRPADTAGFSDEPAATPSSVATLDQRLDALERQMADILRQSEENGHALQNLQADIGRARAAQDQRIGAIEQRLNDAAAVSPVVSEPIPPASTKPVVTKPPVGKPKGEAATSTPVPEGGPVVAAATDPGEDAYTEGFRLWEAGQYDQAITSLRAFTSAYPKHRRVSFANNLIGRALLDKGQPRAAAEALLANYRTNPQGERAADSLYYLGQALTKLGQPGQACKAYQELDAVYGDKARADLRKMVKDAEAQAQCG
jgi:TolA-binding protein